jgi:hypothetical protein
MLFFMKIGQNVVFDLEAWIGEEMIMEEHTAEILDICIDPLGRHESKCIVTVDSEKYGIPFSQIKQVLPANGQQLEIF